LSDSPIEEAKLDDSYSKRVNHGFVAKIHLLCSDDLGHVLSFINISQLESTI
jgi:hypothetical protein